MLIILSHDVSPNPGPSGPRSTGPTNYANPLKLMHWNLNSLLAGVNRISLIESYNAIQSYDFIALTESKLASTTLNESIQLDGYTPIRRDLPTGTY